MIDVDAFVTLRDVENGLRRLQLAGGDLRAVFMKARKAVRADQRQHASKQEGPDGAWAALSSKTIEKRRARTHAQGRKRKRRLKPRTWRKLGRLPKAFSITIAPRSITATSRVKSWSGAQQDGGKVGRGARLPGRPFLWASSGLLQTVARLAMDYLLTTWEKG